MHGGLAGHHAGAQRLLDRVEYREGDQDQAVLQGPDREALAIGGGVHVRLAAEVQCGLAGELRGPQQILRSDRPEDCVEDEEQEQVQ